MGEKEKASLKTAPAHGKFINWELEREGLFEAMKAVFDAKKGKDIYHVISRSGRWGVLREGNRKMYKIYDDKQAAVDHAKRLARKSAKWEVVVHKKDASLDQLISPDNA
jgi:hypothetical protein